MAARTQESDRRFYQHLEWARHYAWMAVGSKRPSEAEAVESAALVGLWKASMAFDPAGGASFQTYARIRIYGEIVDTLRADTNFHRSRKTQRFPMLECDLEAMPDGDPTLLDNVCPNGVDPTARIEIRELAFKALHAIRDPRIRRMVRWHYLKGMTMQQVADRDGSTESNVSKHLVHALRLMRRVLRAGKN